MILRAYLNYDKDQWKALPDSNKKELLESVRLMFDIATAASPFPVTPRQAAEGIFFGKIIKVASLLKYTSLGRLATKTGVSIAEKEAVQAIKTTLTRDIRFAQRRAKANKPKSFCINSFRVQSECGDYVNPHVNITNNAEVDEFIKKEVDDYIHFESDTAQTALKFRNMRMKATDIPPVTGVGKIKTTIPQKFELLSKKFSEITDPIAKAKLEKLVLSKVYKATNVRKLHGTVDDLTSDLTKNWKLDNNGNVVEDGIWAENSWEGGVQYNKVAADFEVDKYTILKIDLDNGLGGMSRKKKNVNYTSPYANTNPTGSRRDILNATDALRTKYFDTTLNEWKEPFTGLLKNSDGTTATTSLYKQLNNLGLTFHHSHDMKNMLLMPMNVHELFSHLGGSGLSVKFNQFAKKVAGMLGEPNNQTTINSFYDKIKTWYSNTYL